VRITPANVPFEHWIKNTNIQPRIKSILIKSGYWHTDLKLPVSADLEFCIDQHGIYSVAKYKALLADKGWVEALQSQLPVLSDGILHTGPVNHYHYLLNGIGSLSPEIFTD
jgi:hypothetical protein